MTNKFNKYANVWHDENAEMSSLHSMNKLRVSLLDQYSPWVDKKVLDIGCGGGLLSEELAKKGAQVTAFDESFDLVSLAESRNIFNINYSVSSLADYSFTHHKFDAIFMMEVIEHIDNFDLYMGPIVDSLKNDGLLFISAPNRNLNSFLFNIVLAEYVFNMLPVGTHRYHELVNLKDLLNILMRLGLKIQEVKGVWYNSNKGLYWSVDTSLHYTIIAKK